MSEPLPYSYPTTAAADEVTPFEDAADTALDNADQAASLERIVTEVGRAIVLQLRANRALHERELASLGEGLAAIDSAIAELPGI